MSICSTLTALQLLELPLSASVPSSALAAFPNLTCLRLKLTAIRPESVYSNLSLLTSLRALCLSFTEDAPAAALDALSALKELRALDLHFRVNPPVHIPAIASLTALQILNLKVPSSLSAPLSLYVCCRYMYISVYLSLRL
jgi:hypothetical protein